MKQQTLGMMITSLRKEQGMTQLELAEKMGVTDKAVSKWERDLSCPDVNSCLLYTSALIKSSSNIWISTILLSRIDKGNP